MTAAGLRGEDHLRASVRRASQLRQRASCRASGRPAIGRRSPGPPRAPRGPGGAWSQTVRQAVAPSRTPRAGPRSILGPEHEALARGQDLLQGLPPSRSQAGPRAQQPRHLDPGPGLDPAVHSRNGASRSWASMGPTVDLPAPRSPQQGDPLQGPGGPPARGGAPQGRAPGRPAWTGRGWPARPRPRPRAGETPPGSHWPLSGPGRRGVRPGAARGREGGLRPSRAWEIYCHAMAG